MDTFTELEDNSVFYFEPMSTHSYEKDYDVQMEISVEMNLDLTVISREGYTILDFISDIGGMQVMIFSFLAVVLTFWNYNYFDDYLITKLFRLQQKDEGVDKIDLNKVDR